MRKSTLEAPDDRAVNRAPRGRVMLVDDDDLFRESLGRNLLDSGFVVDGFKSGEAALSHLSDGATAEVILLDWKMPGMNGIEVLRLMRQSAVGIPVIFLTALNDQIYEEAALQGGAVDFVEKSRSFAILLKRIDLILAGARSKPETEREESVSPVLQDGALALHREIGRAFWDEQQVDLTYTEFSIVLYLVSRADQDVRYRDIYDVVRGEDFIAGQGEEGYRANVRAFIKRIRQKFRDVDENFARIRNYPGFGYRWLSDGAENEQ